MSPTKSKFLASSTFALSLALAIAYSPAFAEPDPGHESPRVAQETEGHGDGDEEGHDAHGEEADADHAHDDEDDHALEEGHAEEEGHVNLSASQLENTDIEIAKATAGTLTLSTSLFGVIRPDLEKLVHIVPRFPGIVTEVKRRIGDEVSKGDVLLSVESNESLRSYTLRSPIAGRIIQRNVAPGQFADTETPLMVVADMSSVWLDLQVHRHDAGLVREGQRVTFRLEDEGDPVAATIGYVSPIAAQDTQSVLARAYVPNPDGRLQPGIFVSASVEQEKATARVVVGREAILYDGASSFVYVPGEEKGSFERLEVKTGRSDEKSVEIVDGLDPGSTYVAGNAFILKAEAGKNAASHAH
ncbi:MAG: efflux transporter periplasmic adaptor subunit [Parvibaculum sp.]|jgi:cobalt-zinc-cadmium efflux system membrane fusion protein|uniref:efflux RND transporter periplasmic adaptor subunit n=2 Tax=Parvibaculum sp. TaxID=2024848 RepID=UPI000C58A61B|nr:efflux RND transporter periplasmic adaptor subunit [Parvibaculum sp.]MAU61750.1 efflux transporter periplasmic adaptor subunit [Parvibaculum sp.]|tara:strand:+ start:5746 stop:6819 length:1074 start_codon:yes stop_codon:yes gene_type:complete